LWLKNEIENNWKFKKVARKKKSWPNLKNKKNENFRLKDTINNNKKNTYKKAQDKEIKTILKYIKPREPPWTFKC
jgi:leucyl aminopeptidase (aminopeptidase T)